MAGRFWPKHVAFIILGYKFSVDWPQKLIYIEQHIENKELWSDLWANWYMWAVLKSLLEDT